MFKLNLNALPRSFYSIVFVVEQIRLFTDECHEVFHVTVHLLDL